MAGVASKGKRYWLFFINLVVVPGHQYNFRK